MGRLSAAAVAVAVVATAGCRKADTPRGRTEPVEVPPVMRYGGVVLHVAVRGDREAAAQVLRKRLAAFRESTLLESAGAVVSAEGEDGLRVEVGWPDAACRSEALAALQTQVERAVTRSGRLEFFAESAADRARLQGWLRGVPGVTLAAGERVPEGGVAARGVTLAAVRAFIAKSPPPGVANIRLEERTRDGKSDHGVTIWLLEAAPRVTGTALASAQVTFDEQDGRPRVAVDFTAAGARRFADVTAELTQHHLAIVFEGDVVSGPRVQEPIRGGRAQIMLGSGPPKQMLRDARQLAALLSAGALEADVELRGTESRCVP